MMGPMSRVFALGALVAALLVPIEAAGQAQLLGTVGLGRPGRGTDARARALGGAAVALHGGNFSAINTAALARINTPGVFLTFGQENRDIEGEAVSGDFATADFPVIRAAIPLGRHVLSISVANFLDQDWGVEFVDTLRLSSGDVPFQETRESDGGVSEFRFEWASVISQRLSLGIAGLLFSGETRQRVEKAFQTESGFRPFESETSIEYSGWGASLSAEYEPLPEMLVGAVFRWGGDLDARTDGGSELDTQVPLALEVGGSWQLTPELVVAVTSGFENWGELGGDLPEARPVDVWRFGGGIELRALSNPSSALFLRLGGRLERLPFEVGEGAPWERVGAFGLGLNLREGRGRIDASMELGNRADLESNGVEESFTRFMFGLSIFTS